MIKSEKERQELNAALEKALKLLESTVSWAEAKGYTDEQEYLSWEMAINSLSVKDHKINFFKYKHMD